MHQLLFTIIALIYPFAVYYGLNHFEPRIFSLLLICLAFLYFFFPKATTTRTQKYLVITVIIILVLGLQLLNDVIFIKLYPVLMNLLFLCMFAYTLHKPPSMVERFARIKHKDLPPFAIAYTRGVTVAWCIFLFINSLISIYTALFASLQTWTLYNGFISYCLMGALFVGEYIVRYFVTRKHL